MAGRLDPVFEQLYSERMANTPMRPPDLAVLRTNYSVLYSYATAAGPEVRRIYDDRILLEEGQTLDVRIYEPSTPGPWPVHLDFHGGGWSLGDLDSESHICRHICAKAGVAVIDVAYRIAPEHPYPTAVTDSFGALKFVHGQGAARFNIRPDSISVGGVSAGAFIALSLAHLAAEASIPLVLVVAGTPVIDDLSQYASAADSPYASMRENEFAPTLNWARLTWFDKLRSSTLPSESIAREAAKRDMGWLINLLNAPKATSSHPRTVIVTAGADPLRDEGERYAQKLVEEGVEVTLRRYLGVPHPFMHMDKELWQGRAFIDLISREIRLAHYEMTRTVPLGI